MLSDSQIERYSRQIVLSEIGGRGQERLLASEVAIHGGGDGALVCARYLAGAGVGLLGLADAAARTALAREERNPDCRIASSPSASPAVVIVIGGRLAVELSRRATVLWGSAESAVVSRVHIPPGRACAPCLDAFARRQPPNDGSAQVLGTLLALDALRALLELGQPDEPSLLRMDLARAKTSTLPFPSRPGCSTCR